MARPEDLQSRHDTALALPPKPLEERLRLSDKQQRIVSELAVTYLQRNKVDFTNPNLQAALAVLGIDVLYRGLLLEGRDEVTAKDNVRALIRTGLEQRASVQAQAVQVLSENLDHARASDEEYIGPLALSKNTLLGSAREKRSFPVLPDIRNSEEAAYLAQARSVMLPRIVGLAITALPHEQYPQAGLERFPDAIDQAKIVRNMLTSLAYRRTPIPAISIEELQQFVYSPIALEEAFAPDFPAQVAQALAPAIDTPEADLTSYIHDLTLQTSEAFRIFTEKGLPNLQQADIGAIREQLYRAFGNKLMLLNPILEEEPLITNPEKAGTSVNTIWRPDLSVVMHGVRIPTMDGLFRAIRYYEARGLETVRFTDGISAWRSLMRSGTREHENRARLKVQIAQVDKEVKRLRNKGEKYSQYANFLVRVKYPDEAIKLAAARHRQKVSRETIKESNRRRSEATKYINSVREKHGGTLLEAFEMPQEVLEAKKTAQESHKTWTEAAMPEEVSFYVNVITRDFFGTRDFLNPGTASDLQSASVESLQAEIDHLTELQDQYLQEQADAMYQYPTREIPQRLGEINTYLTSQIARLTRQNQNPRDSFDNARQGMLRALTHLQTRIGEKTNINRSDARLVEQFYKFSFQTRIRALDRVITAKNKLAAVENLEPVSPLWTAEEATYWYRRAMAGTVDINPYSSDELRYYLEDLAKWQKSLEVTVELPKIIPSREDLAAWIENKAQELEDFRVTEYTPETEYQKARHERRVHEAGLSLEALKHLSEIMNNPLFPLTDGEGLTSWDFRDAVGRRLRYINAVLSVDELREETKDVEAQLDILKRRVYRKHLEKRKKALQKERFGLKGNIAPELKFVERMRELNLAVEEPAA